MSGENCAERQQVRRAEKTLWDFAGVYGLYLNRQNPGPMSHLLGSNVTREEREDSC